MVKITAQYQGSLRCQVTHGPSGLVMETDAPVDNHGRGERFSPTDLLGAAITTCTLTVMGIAAQRDGIKLEGARAEVTKVMSKEPPRRVSELKVKITMPRGLTPEQRQKLEMTARACPVAKSIHPEIQAAMEFSYPD